MVTPGAIVAISLGSIAILVLIFMMVVVRPRRPWGRGNTPLSERWVALNSEHAPGDTLTGVINPVYLKNVILSNRGK